MFVYVGCQYITTHNYSWNQPSMLKDGKTEPQKKLFEQRNVDGSKQGKCNLGGKFHSFKNNLDSVGRLVVQKKYI